MSLEQAIQDNTAAIRDLIASLGNKASGSPLVTNAEPTPVSTKSTSTKKTKAAESAPAVEPETVAEVDFKTVQTAAIKYVAAAGGKQHLTALLKKNFGVEKISEKPDSYAEMLSAIEKATTDLSVE